MDDKIDIILGEIRELRAELRLQSGASLNAGQAAEYLGVSERTLMRYVELGRLGAIDMSTEPGGKKRGRVMFTRNELDRFRESNALPTG